MHDMMMVLSRKSYAVVWMVPWKNWPRMIPADINLMVYRQASAIPEDLASRIGSFGLAVYRTLDGLGPSDLSNENLDDLSLKRAKCELSWTFLHRVQEIRLREKDDHSAMLMIDRWYNEIWLAADPCQLDNVRMGIGDHIGFYPMSS